MAEAEGITISLPFGPQRNALTHGPTRSDARQAEHHGRPRPPIDRNGGRTARLGRVRHADRCGRRRGTEPGRRRRGPEACSPPGAACPPRGGDVHRDVHPGCGRAAGQQASRPSISTWHTRRNRRSTAARRTARRPRSWSKRGGQSRTSRHGAKRPRGAWRPPASASQRLSGPLNEPAHLRATRPTVIPAGSKAAHPSVTPVTSAARAAAGHQSAGVRCFPPAPPGVDERPVRLDQNSFEASKQAG